MACLRRLSPKFLLWLRARVPPAVCLISLITRGLAGQRFAHRLFTRPGSVRRLLRPTGASSCALRAPCSPGRRISYSGSPRCSLQPGSTTASCCSGSPRCSLQPGSTTASCCSGSPWCSLQPGSSTASCCSGSPRCSLQPRSSSVLRSARCSLQPGSSNRRFLLARCALRAARCSGPPGAPCSPGSYNRRYLVFRSARYSLQPRVGHASLPTGAPCSPGRPSGAC